MADAQAAYQDALAAAERACFVAGTLILTPTGRRAIESLQVGEIVLAGDPITGAVKECRILQTFVHQVSQIFDLQVGNETIGCSAEHPFWVVDQGWTAAAKLQVGDRLITSAGRVVTVQGMRSRLATVNVYNFEVEHLHTYFVSDLGILVHNTCFDPTQLSVLNSNAAASALASGAGQNVNIRVRTRQEVVGLLRDYIEGRGFRNSTGFTGNQVRNNPDRFPTGKAGTFHWDYADTQHGGVPHIQIHDFDGSIKRIFFDEGAGLPISPY